MPASSGFTESRTLLLTLRDGAPAPIPYTTATLYAASTPYTASTPYAASTPYTAPTPYTAAIPYTLVRSHRKSLAIIVRPDSSLEVRIPLRCREDELQKFLQSHTSWILSHMASQAKKRKEREARTPRLSDEEKIAIQKEAVKRLRPILLDRIAYYEPMLPPSHRPITRVSIRSQKTRWGSCSSRGTLSFNWKLYLTAPECLDYVVVHELCHLVHMDHSPAFWAEVERIMPDYRTWKKWLRDNGDTLV